MTPTVSIKAAVNLMHIRGIGAVRKRWLHSLGITTIANLAQASANDIEAQAKRDGRTLSRDELETWITQAQVQHVKASFTRPDRMAKKRSNVVR